MNSSPLVSIVVPSYNHAHYVVQTIESIINQTYKNFELTVIDDGSKDASREILADLQTKYGFNLVLQQNIGVGQTLNKAIKNHCNGKYFTFCASDDYWAEDKLEKQVKFMEQNPEYPMCYGKAYMIDHSGRIDKKLTVDNNKSLKGGYIFKDLILMNFHPPVNYLFNKSIFDKVGLYTETWAEDFYMNLKISENHPIGFIDDYICYYRTSNNVKAKVVNLKVVNSHKETIDLYTDSEYYEEAVKLWYLRCFYIYSKYAATKKLAFAGMTKNLNKLADFNYAKAVFRLLFIWK